MTMDRGERRSREEIRMGRAGCERTYCGGAQDLSTDKGRKGNGEHACRYGG